MCDPQIPQLPIHAVYFLCRIRINHARIVTVVWLHLMQSLRVVGGQHVRHLCVVSEQLLLPGLHCLPLQALILQGAGQDTHFSFHIRVRVLDLQYVSRRGARRVLHADNQNFCRLRVGFCRRSKIHRGRGEREGDCRKQATRAQRGVVGGDRAALLSDSNQAHSYKCWGRLSDFKQGNGACLASGRPSLGSTDHVRFRGVLQVSVIVISLKTLLVQFLPGRVPILCDWSIGKGVCSIYVHH